MPVHHTHGFPRAAAALGKEKEGNQHEQISCQAPDLGLHASRCDRSYMILLRSYWITDIIMTILGLKKLREGGGTSGRVPSSPGTFQCPTGSLWTVLHFCLLHHWSRQGEKGNVQISTMGKPQ